MKNLELSVKDREKEAGSRSGWGKLLFDVCNRLKYKIVGHLKLKRTLRENDVDLIPEDVHSVHVCNIFGNIVP